MGRWIRRAAWVAGTLAVLAAGVLLVGLRAADSRMSRKVDVPARQLVLKSEAASVERGKYLFASRGCTDCHGADGNGRTFVDNGSLRLRGSKISPGPGSVTAAYKPEDWVRAIRHGVHPAGRPLMIMPSEDYNRFTDDDVGSLVAYIR